MKHLRWALTLLVLFSLPLSAEESGGAPFHIDLRAFPIYLKNGFDMADIVSVPSPSDSRWLVTEPFWENRNKTILVKNLENPGVSGRRFLSPFDRGESEYTILIPFTLYEHDMNALRTEPLLVPAVFFASLKDNWEFYLNGTPVRREMHLDKNGRIVSHRSWREIYFPVDRSLFTGGTNILAIRLAGSWNSKYTGMYYGSPYFIGDFDTITRKYNEAVILSFCTVYVFLGLYHLFLFISNRKRMYYLAYSFFSLCMGLSFFSKTHTIVFFIPDSNIFSRIEYSAQLLAALTMAVFIEYLNIKKLRLITKIFGVFCLLLTVTICTFSITYAEDALWLIWMSLGFSIVYTVGYNVLYTFFKENTGPGKSRLRALYTTPLGNILSGSFILVGAVIADIADAIFIHSGLMISQYGFLAFTVSVTLILAKTYGDLNKQLERKVKEQRRYAKKLRRIISRSRKGMNAKLVDWIVVQDRDPRTLPPQKDNRAIMFTDIRDFTRMTEAMTTDSVFEFLNSFNEVISGPLFAAEKSGAYTDKFIGDAAMNIFPDAALALETAVEMRRTLDAFNADPSRFFSGASGSLRVDISSGIAYGPVTLGVMGHHHRLDYTPLGDTVNLASRLESLTREYRCPVLLNGALAKLVTKNTFHLRYIDRIRVKGKEEPIDLYEEYSADDPALREYKAAAAEKFGELREIYFSGKNWKDGFALAVSLVQGYRKKLARSANGAAIPEDYLPYLYTKRMRYILADPKRRESWDGVFTFLSK